MNGNAEIDENEFNDVFDNSGLFDDWNSNNEDGIDENEAADGIFSFFDEDNDGFLGRDEAADGWNLFEDNQESN